MGDIADLIIEGTLCECCGEWIGDAVGYPRKCPYCISEEINENKKKSKKKQKK